MGRLVLIRFAAEFLIKSSGLRCYWSGVVKLDRNSRVGTKILRRRPYKGNRHRRLCKVLPTSRYGYLVTDTDGNETLSANRQAFEHVYLRAMRMVDTSRVSLATSLLGMPVDSPIVLASVGTQ
jgi:hypothetical protein